MGQRRSSPIQGGGHNSNGWMEIQDIKRFHDEIETNQDAQYSVNSKQIPQRDY